MPLDYIRITQDQVHQNAKNMQKAEKQALKETKEDEKVGDFVFPEHLRVGKNDTEKSREQKRKKVKALKLTYKTQV